MVMKNSLVIFQKAMETILSGLEGIIIYEDDVLVFAEDDASLKERLNMVTA